MFFSFAIVSNSWSLWQCLDIWWQYNAARCDSRYILVGFLAMPMAFIDGKVRRQKDGNGIFLFSLFPHFMTWVLRLQWCLHVVGDVECWHCHIIKGVMVVIWWSSCKVGRLWSLLLTFIYWFMVGFLATAFGNGKDGIRTTIKVAWCFLLSFVVVCQQ